MINILPSYDLTPSRAFKRPEKVTFYLLSYCSLTLSLSTNIASISSSNMIDLIGAQFNIKFNPSSSIDPPDKFK
jgi:hypothetical protein